MSERGSFVTEYVYCEKCFKAIQPILLDNEKFLCSRILPSWEEGQDLPIIAGKIGGLYGSEELHTFDFELNEKISKVICHPVRIAVLAEQGEEIFSIKPITEEEIKAEELRRERIAQAELEESQREVIPIEKMIENLETDIKHEEEKQKEIQSVITPPSMEKAQEWKGGDEMKHSIFTVHVEYPTPTKLQPFAVYTKVDTWDIVVERMEENLPILKEIENGDLVIKVKLEPKQK